MSMALSHFSLCVPNLSYFLVQFSFMGHPVNKIYLFTNLLTTQDWEMKSEISNFVTIWLSMKEKVGFHLSANEGERRLLNLYWWIWIMVHSGTKELQNKMLVWQGTQMGEGGYFGCNVRWSKLIQTEPPFTLPAILSI